MEILDEEVKDNTEELLAGVKRQRKIFFWILAGISVADGVLAASQRTAPSASYKAGYFTGAILGAFLVLMVLGLIIGSLVNFMPYKGLSYGRKFWRSVFLVSVVFGVITLLGRVMMMILSGVAVNAN